MTPFRVIGALALAASLSVVAVQTASAQDAPPRQKWSFSGPFGIYIAGNALQNTGWRPFSDDSLRQLYAVFSVRTDGASLDLSFTRGDNQMDGQGPAPVQELAVNRSLVFTGPQTNINRLDFLNLNGSLKLTDDGDIVTEVQDWLTVVLTELMAVRPEGSVIVTWNR